MHHRDPKALHVKTTTTIKVGPHPEGTHVKITQKVVATVLGGSSGKKPGKAFLATDPHFASGYEDVFGTGKTAAERRKYAANN